MIFCTPSSQGHSPEAIQKNNEYALLFHSVRNNALRKNPANLENLDKIVVQDKK